MFGRPSPPGGDTADDRASEPLFRGAQPAPPARPPASASDLPASRPRTPISTLSSALHLQGDLSGEADLQIDGVLKGDVRVTRLVVGPTARIEGAVRAHHVEVRGRVVGSIEAQVVRLHESAHVEGDISHGQLAIESGAHFEGRVQPLRAAAAATETRAEEAAEPERPSAEVRHFPASEPGAGAAAAEVSAA